jgi:hypothetical protein
MRDVKRRVCPESFRREAADRVASRGLSGGAAAQRNGRAHPGAATRDIRLRGIGAVDARLRHHPSELMAHDEGGGAARNTSLESARNASVRRVWFR